MLLPSIHPSFHGRFLADHKKAEYGVVFLGNVHTHPDAEMRRAEIAKIENAGIEVLTIGTGGKIGHLEGKKLLAQLSMCKIGLSLLNNVSTLPHRIFEYAAVGLCVVSTITPTIADCFAPYHEIIPYNVSMIQELLDNPKKCASVANNGRIRCFKDHTMQKRIELLLERLSDV